MMYDSAWQFYVSMLAESQTAESCGQIVRAIVEKELESADPDFASVSICLGALESSLTNKSAQSWPVNLEADVANGRRAFADFVEKATRKLEGGSKLSTREKVKLVADFVWSHLTTGFSKEVQHVQHVLTFTQILEAPKAHSKRQLDCAGVVTTTLAACQQIAKSLEHEDLSECRLQVSEDHCWISISQDGERSGSVEITTDTAAKRGQEVAEDAWRGWLYTGGHAVLCSPKMTITAMIASMNPSIIHRQNTGTDSEELQQIQIDLLKFVKERHPEAMYPAATCVLADLVEIWRQDDMQRAMTAIQADELSELLERSNDDAQALFEEAVQASMQKHLGNGRCWYPHSYLIGFLTRRAQFVLKDALQLLGERKARSIGDPLLARAINSCGSSKAASVLRHYRFLPVDEQLHKDVEGILEMVCEILKYLHSRGEAGSALEDGSLLCPVLELWDGICCCWAAKPKPAPWIGIVLKTAKLFSPAARGDAAISAETQSPAMRKSQEMWTTLKPQLLKPIFEAADVQAEVRRPAKRARH